MTENEAIQVLTSKHTSIGTSKCDDVEWRKLQPAIDEAVKSLEEIQQYREIGTVEEIRKVVRFLSMDNDNGIIKDLQLLNQYQFIGTVEECREAREKQIAKKPIHGGLYACPNCHTIMLQGAFEAKGKCCKECGQALDWSETV